MKLRHKTTGKIIEVFPGRININSGSWNYGYDPLADLNEDWEDYKEPKMKKRLCVLISTSRSNGKQSQHGIYSVDKAFREIGRVFRHGMRIERIKFILVPMKKGEKK